MKEWGDKTIRITVASCIGSLIIPITLYIIAKKKNWLNCDGDKGIMKFWNNLGCCCFKNRITYLRFFIINILIFLILQILAISLPLWSKFKDAGISIGVFSYCINDSIASSDCELIEADEDLFTLIWLWFIRAILIISCITAFISILLYISLERKYLKKASPYIIFKISSITTIMTYISAILGLLGWIGMHFDSPALFQLTFDVSFYLSISGICILTMVIICLLLPTVYSIMSFLDEEESVGMTYRKTAPIITKKKEQESTNNEQKRKPPPPPPRRDGDGGGGVYSPPQLPEPGLDAASLSYDDDLSVLQETPVNRPQRFYLQQRPEV